MSVTTLYDNEMIKCLTQSHFISLIISQFFGAVSVEVQTDVQVTLPFQLLSNPIKFHFGIFSWNKEKRKFFPLFKSFTLHKNMFLCQKPHYIMSLNATVLRCTSPRGQVRKKKESDKCACITFK